ncbi:MAG TPA: dihydroneopterin aldolase [Nitrososphaerales archaeon]|nr:dihydroneopterin aldolase [Nitrososphaerales archaeon]
MDKIFIENLAIPCNVGLTESEQLRKQTLIVDLYIFRDLRDAGKLDELAKTISYSEIRSQIFDFVSKGKFTLLEAIAEGIASLILKNSSVVKTRVRVRKKKYSIAPKIGVEILRTRNG